MAASVSIGIVTTWFLRIQQAVSQARCRHAYASASQQTICKLVPLCGGIGSTLVFFDLAGEQLSLMDELRFQLSNSVRKGHRAVPNGLHKDSVAHYITDQNMLTHWVESQSQRSVRTIGEE